MLARDFWAWSVLFTQQRGPEHSVSPDCGRFSLGRPTNAGYLLGVPAKLAAKGAGRMAVGVLPKLAGLLVGTASWWAAGGMAQAQAPVEGTWRTMLASEITISACPEGFCGVLSKIVVPQGQLSAAEAQAVAAMAPEDFVDARNKDPQLRSRPMLGLQILTLRPGDKPAVFDGSIYNPQDGNTYSGYVQVTGADALRLNGCVLFNVICRGEDWVRVPPEELAGGAPPPEAVP